MRKRKIEKERGRAGGGGRKVESREREEDWVWEGVRGIEEDVDRGTEGYIYIYILYLSIYLSIYLSVYLLHNQLICALLQLTQDNIV